MSTQLAQPASQGFGKRAYVLLRMVEELEIVRGGVTTSYGAEQCNNLLEATLQLSADDPDVSVLLQDLKPLETRIHPFAAARLAGEANVFLAKLKGALRAIIGLYMEQQERQRLGV